MSYYKKEIDALSLQCVLADNSDYKLRAIGTGTAKEILERAVNAAVKEQIKKDIEVIKSCKIDNPQSEDLEYNSVVDDMAKTLNYQLNPKKSSQ